ncbi:MAG: hypothetical protein AAF333_18080 [Planctomycetota bacterium]
MSSVYAWSVGLLILGCAAGPLVASYLVINRLLYVTHVEPYWIKDGLILSAAINFLTVVPLFFVKVRQNLRVYLATACVAGTAVSMVVYRLFLLSLMGV